MIVLKLMTRNKLKKKMQATKTHTNNNTNKLMRIIIIVGLGCVVGFFSTTSQQTP